MPDGVKLSLTRDATQVDLETRYSELCEELTALISNYLLAASEQFKQQIMQIFQEQLRAVARASDLLFMRAYLTLLSGAWARSMAQARLKAAALTYKIESPADASLAGEWLSNVDPSHATIAQVFVAKATKLAELEHRRGSIGSLGVATVEPDSVFSTTYVFKFPRGIMESRHFNIAVEGMYRDLDSDKQYVSSAANTLVISPRPWFLSLVAILGAVLGVVLQLSSKENGTGFVYNMFKAFPDAWETAAHPLVSAVIISIIFFNVYEYTDLGKKFTMGVGWRSALLIGFLSGMLGDRLVAALTALLGTS
jgi:hypothetical protein